MKDKTLILVGGLTLLAACGGQVETPKFDAPETTLTTIGNPYIPLWDHIPDGEPYVFEDPDNPGKFRVYVYGSHDIEVKNYCGRDQVVWSADVNDLNHWRMDGVILKVDKNGKGEPQKEAGAGSILMSLWKVDDNATALFMTEFYKHLFATNDRHKALKLAQNETKKQFPEPRHWAAWVMLD